MDEHDVQLTVDGDDHDLTVEPHRLLVHTLREDLDCTGVKIGCETGLCGACTVHINGRPVKSCTTFTVSEDGADVTTIEGVGDDADLAPVQESFHEEHGLQCGYCTPGMVMTTLSLLDEDPDPDREEIRERLEGNLCRCTGYQNIVTAVETAAEKRSGD